MINVLIKAVFNGNYGGKQGQVIPTYYTALPPR
jgi:hypothetical protein